MPNFVSANKKFRSAVVWMGGVSREREISIKSGKAVAAALRQAGVLVEEVDIGSDSLKVPAQKNPEAVFLALHGTGGEDGTIQEILEARRVPYTGSSPEGSKAAFFKDQSKEIFTRVGIPTPEYQLFNRNNAVGKIGFSGPWVIKPVAEGSSIGVVMVENESNLKSEITNLLRDYSKVMVEKRIIGQELTVGILEESALPVIELKTTRGFYDFKAKYTAGFTEYLVPAPLNIEMAKKIQDVALRVHKVLGLSDLSRIDIMLDHAGRPYVLEANSIPGFTDSSLLPKAARYAGIGFSELCLRILNSASLKQMSAVAG